ncbi:hypothetical protein ACJJIQ_10030 [Microbulbifer sp. ANSA003]|uniref:hypothetical protein n=1 Tax=Microbulbifer sp. ANSA003 TaxID=3243360 RepID=UPI004043868F
MNLQLALTLLFFAQFAIADDNLFYVGTWQSNEEMTLASMDGVEGMPEKTQMFLRSEFFGRLVNVVRVDSFATYFIEEKPKELTFLPHKVEVLSTDSIRVTYHDELTKSDETRILKYEKNCYSLPVTKWEFREYFCRAE